MKSFFKKLAFKFSNNRKKANKSVHKPDLRIKQAKRIKSHSNYNDAKKKAVLFASRYHEKGWYPRVERDYSKPGNWVSYIVKYK